MNAAATRLPVRMSLEFMFVFLLCGATTSAVTRQAQSCNGGAYEQSDERRSGRIPRRGCRYRGDVSSRAAGHEQISMMGPLALAYERSVLERPKDGGLFGPRSMVWRVHRDRSFPLAAIRSLLSQALHPLPMAAGAHHGTCH